MAMKVQSNVTVEKALPFRYQFAAGAVAGISEVCELRAWKGYMLIHV